MIRLTLYSCPGCHLCDEMKALVRRATRHLQVEIVDVDISGDADLEARYGAEIPVLLVDGRKVAKFRISERELMRILDARPDTTSRVRPV